MRHSENAAAPSVSAGYTVGHGGIVGNGFRCADLGTSGLHPDASVVITVSYCGSRCRRSVMRRLDTRVLASTSKIKRDAMRSAFPGSVVYGVSVPSGVNAQPIGRLEIQTGALSRCESVAALYPTLSRVYGIESGLVRRGSRWYDVACVLEYETGCRAGRAVFSKEVEVPAQFVNAEVRTGRVTFADVMKRLTPSVATDDPHKTLTGKSRRDYLCDALNGLFQSDLQLDVVGVDHGDWVTVAHTL